MSRSIRLMEPTAKTTEQRPHAARTDHRANWDLSVFAPDSCKGVRFGCRHRARLPRPIRWGEGDTFGTCALCNAWHVADYLSPNFDSDIVRHLQSSIPKPSSCGSTTTRREAQSSRPMRTSATFPGSRAL